MLHFLHNHPEIVNMLRLLFICVDVASHLIFQ